MRPKYWHLLLIDLGSTVFPERIPRKNILKEYKYFALKLEKLYLIETENFYKQHICIQVLIRTISKYPVFYSEENVVKFIKSW